MTDLQIFMKIEVFRIADNESKVRFAKQYSEFDWNWYPKDFWIAFKNPKLSRIPIKLCYQRIFLVTDHGFVVKPERFKFFEVISWFQNERESGKFDRLFWIILNVLCDVFVFFFFFSIYFIHYYDCSGFLLFICYITSICKGL